MKEGGCGMTTGVLIGHIPNWLVTPPEPIGFGLHPVAGMNRGLDIRKWSEGG